jgi:hypothetical protein
MVSTKLCSCWELVYSLNKRKVLSNYSYMVKEEIKIKAGQPQRASQQVLT